MNVQFDFQDRHVVVFGGTTGINLGIAQAYAAAGAKFSVASRKQANVDAAFSTLGAHGFGVVADVRDDDSVAAALGACVARHGPIDVPKLIRFVEALPATATGKVQKHLLCKQFAQMAADAWAREA